MFEWKPRLRPTGCRSTNSWFPTEAVEGVQAIIVDIRLGALLVPQRVSALLVRNLQAPLSFPDPRLERLRGLPDQRPD